MASNDFLAEASVQVDAGPERVWQALVDPEEIRAYMFGANVLTDWREGSPILWKGEWEGRAYEDRGVVRVVQPHRRLSYTHFSPLSGLADAPENYHTVTVDLAAAGTGTRVTLTQDNNATPEERDHSQKNWALMLEGLKKHVESH
jgi:uncharacterized protein YndB with AHSA1/START domain